jgi:hypothetical protein
VWCTLDATEVQLSALQYNPEWGQVHNSGKFGWHTITGTLLNEKEGTFTSRPLPNGNRPGLPTIWLDDRDI